jgi:hypothetical protein
MLHGGMWFAKLLFLVQIAVAAALALGWYSWLMAAVGAAWDIQCDRVLYSACFVLCSSRYTHGQQQPSHPGLVIYFTVMRRCVMQLSFGLLTFYLAISCQQLCFFSSLPGDVV